MSSEKIIISGTGCALGDLLYDGISFTGSEFEKFISRSTGDGGLSPGRLVFTEELEKFSGCRYTEILKKITGGRKPSGFNVGGPGLVSMIHASQMLNKEDFVVRFFGIAGKDETSASIYRIIKNTPLDTANYLPASARSTPFTDVFSDPAYNNGQGERTFVNNIGAAWDYYPQSLGDDFYRSQVICLGGTALVPNLHDHLTEILEKAKKSRCITIVNTVYDFRAEKAFPGKPWPVGNKRSFSLIDILIMDSEEARKISGKNDLKDAAAFFISSGVSSFLITNGPGDVIAWSDGSLFVECSLTYYPVSEIVREDLKLRPGLKGDTTGCGDNFAGGIIASVAMQLKSTLPGGFCLENAVSLGIASGGFCCYTLGGTYIEKYPGEKREKVTELQVKYLKQIAE